MNKIDNKEYKRVEEESKNEKNRKRLLIMVLSITTLIIAMVGATFAWLTVSVSNIRGNESIVVSATVLEGVTFKASDNLVLVNALPGDSTETTFTIINPNASAKVRYSLKFVADVNDFTNEDGDNQLLIRVKNNKMPNDEIVLDFTNGEETKEAQLVTNVELDANKSDVYTAKLEFAELDKNQMTNTEKNFVGHIEITQSIVAQ